MKEYLRGALRNISSALEYEAVTYTSGEYRKAKPFKGLYATSEGNVSIEGFDGNIANLFLTPGCWPYGGSALHNDSLIVGGNLTISDLPITFPKLYRAPEYNGHESFSETGEALPVFITGYGVYWVDPLWMITAPVGISWFNDSDSLTVPLTGWIPGSFINAGDPIVTVNNTTASLVALF